MAGFHENLCLCFFHIIMFLVHKGASETISINPGGVVTRQLNTGIMLTCEVVDNTPDTLIPDLLWKAPDGNTITAQSGRVHVERMGPFRVILYIANVQTDDAGLYSCQADLAGDVLTADSRLEIFEKISFRDSPDSIEATTGEDTLVECAATGNPEPAITWRFNRKPIITDGLKYGDDPRGLRIFNVNSEDAGFYECRAEVESQGNLKVKHISLDVRYGPIVSYKPPEVTEVILDQVVEIRCQGIGNPDVSYQWFKEHQMSHLSKVKVMLHETTDTFVLESVAKEDAGRYYCKIINEIATEEVFTDIIVLVPPTVSDIPSEPALENSVLFLNCQATGDPEPVITWQRLGTDEPYVEGKQPNDPHVTIQNTRTGTSKLVIHEIQRSHTGQYQCSAVNKAGNDSTIVDVAVGFIPTVNTSEVMQYGWPGETRNFTCTGYGKPLPTLSWLREGQFISNTETYQVHTSVTDVVVSTLQMTISEDEPWIFGKYSCIAKNKYKYVRTEVDLQEATVPDMAGNTTIAEDTPTSVLLRVDHPKNNGGLQVTSWRVQYQPNEDRVDPEDERVLYFEQDAVLEVTDLVPGVVYTFHVSAGNPVGFSDPIKFLVETPEVLDQADLPPPGLFDDTSIHRTGSDAKESKYNSKIKKVFGKDGKIGTSTVTIVVGVTVVLAVIVLVITGTAILIRKRKQNDEDYTNTWKSMFSRSDRSGPTTDTTVRVSESKDIDQVQLQIHRGTGSQPDLIMQATPKAMHIDKSCKSPLMDNRKAAKGESLSRANSNTTLHSIQQRAWDQMLVVQSLAPEEQPPDVVEHGEHVEPRLDEMTPLTPITDLPPPPPFLLDNEDSPHHLLPHPDNISYHDILDGYHSEENIDDREDRFEIRMPIKA